MKKEIKIYIRTDLKVGTKKKVSNGKMAAQSAHALMAVVLSLFKKEENKLILEKENVVFFKELKENKISIKFEEIHNIEELLKIKEREKENAFIIEDQGRTVFKEPTITTMAVVSSGLKLNHYINCKSNINEKYKSKQTLIINKNEIKDKWVMFNSVARASIKFLLNQTRYTGSNYELSLEKEGLKNWINGSFAKITIKPTTCSFDEIMRKRNEIKTFNEVYEENGIPLCIAIGADFLDEIDKYTKDGFNLA